MTTAVQPKPRIDNVLHLSQLNHQGAVHAFAMVDKNASGQGVGFSHCVLQTNPAIPDDDLNWSDPYELDFPKEARTAGMSLLTAELNSLEKTVAAPFQVLSDDKFIYLFRQGDNDTILVDRFVYDKVGKRLNNKWEVRFQRSKKKDVPESKKDSPDWKDMEGKPFLEPTTELPIPIENGKFAVTLVPTNKPSLSYWHILAVNKDDNTKLEVHSIKRDEDGMFAFYGGHLNA